jgi:hypothetical protein
MAAGWQQDNGQQDDGQPPEALATLHLLPVLVLGSNLRQAGALYSSSVL